MLPDRCQNILFLLCSLLFAFGTREAAADTRWGFLLNQADCKVTCLNGGACGYDVADPSRHGCLCMEGLFEGEFCQYPVTSSTSTTEAPPTIAAAAAADEPLYEEEDELHAGGSDVHYTEEGHDVDELHTLGGTSTPGQQPEQPADPLNADDHGEEYAEFEPRRDEVYHQAVMETGETTTAQAEIDTQTESHVYAESEPNYDQTVSPPAYNQEGSEERAEELSDDSYDENDGGWMVFKKRAGRSGGQRSELTLLSVGLLLLTCTLIQF